MNQIVKNEEKEEVKVKTEQNNNQPQKKKSKKGKIIKKILLVLVILFVLGVSTIGILLYGPYNGFRDWLITTGMTSMTHQWIPKLFYSDETIELVMASNRVDEVQEETDTDAISVLLENEIEPLNEYDKQILEKDSDEDRYKVIEISGNGYSGYLVAVYNPANIHTLVTSKLGTTGQYLTTMAKNSNAVVAINGGMFEDPNFNSNGANPSGVTYSNGKLMREAEYSEAGGIIGFDNNDKLILSSNCTAQSAKLLGIRDCVSGGPFLIVNGKASTIVGNGGWGIAPRTAIGQRKDGIVLFLVVDGRTIKRPGASMNDLIEIMQRYGAYNAANLDGGTSSVLVVKNKMINDPIDSTGAHKTRFIATGFGLIDETVNNKKV